MADVRTARFDELDVHTLYALLKLRADVFVVEQECLYSDLDDLDQSARHFWVDGGDAPAAYLRMLDDPDGTARIGRVVVRSDGRGQGLAGVLMAAALEYVGDERTVVLNAQSRVGNLYARFGFETTGPEFLDDGIPHVPMRRTPR